MAAISEKILWPAVAILIFGILAGFYIDDRRGMMEDSAHKQQTSSNEHGGKAAEQKKASNEHAGKAAEKKSTATSSSNSSQQDTNATSMDINEYLAQSSSERSAELEANVAHHQGFSGSIADYLNGVKPKAVNNMQAKKDTQQSAGSDAKNMSANDSNTQSSSQQNASDNGNAYHGGIDDYLAKYGDGKQTKLNKSTKKPFNQKEHMGFHGSYEDYAKKYN